MTQNHNCKYNVNCNTYFVFKPAVLYFNISATSVFSPGCPAILIILPSQFVISVSEE